MQPSNQLQGGVVVIRQHGSVRCTPCRVGAAGAHATRRSTRIHIGEVQIVEIGGLLRRGLRLVVLGSRQGLHRRLHLEFKREQLSAYDRGEDQPEGGDSEIRE